MVTGANKGLGLEMARQVGSGRRHVVLAARDAAKGEEAAGKLRGESLDVQFLKLDVTRAEDRDAAVKFLESKFGRLDILLNNAGISGGDLQAGSKGDQSETLHKVLETNFFAPVALTHALLPLLKKSAAGRIVNMSSILGSLRCTQI